MNCYSKIETSKASAFRNTGSFIWRTVMVVENFYYATILIKVNCYRYHGDKIKNLLGLTVKF